MKYIISGGLSGLVIGAFIVLCMNGTIFCNRNEDHEMLGGIKKRMDIGSILGKQLRVVFMSYDVDSDGLVTASWVYPDHRIGGTDWTDARNIEQMVNEQRYWKVCMGGECLHVIPPDLDNKYHGRCWRHYEIPEEGQQMLIPIEEKDVKETI